MRTIYLHRLSHNVSSITIEKSVGRLLLYLQNEGSLSI